MRILVVLGSERGGTAGIAQRVADTLSELGHEVDLRSARKVDDLGGYEALIVGGRSTPLAGTGRRGASCCATSKSCVLMAIWLDRRRFTASRMPPVWNEATTRWRTAQ